MLYGSSEPFKDREDEEGEETKTDGTLVEKEKTLDDIWDDDLEAEAEAEVPLVTGKRPRAVMIIQSDDEDGDRDERKEKGVTNKKHKGEKEMRAKEGSDSKKLSPKKLTLKRNVGTKRIRSSLPPLDVATPQTYSQGSSAVSTIASAVTVISPSDSPALSPFHGQVPRTGGRRNTGTKKGWKGWVEVEEDQIELAPKAFRLDKLPPANRATRSGRQFN